MSKIRQTPFCLALLAGLLAFMSGTSQVTAAEEITVYLQSGRSFTGFVDAKTDHSQLVLRFEEGWATLWRPMEWGSIVKATYKSHSITPTDLKAGYHNLSSTSAVEEWLSSSEDLPAKQTDPPSYAVPPVPTEPAPVIPKVESLAIQASLGNWNRGTEIDGLVLSLFPLDSYGQVIPASGTLEVELLGLRPASMRSQYVYSRGNPFPILGRWTRRVVQSDISSSGAQFKLPFQSYHPEFDLDLAPHGMVRVRFSIPGQGTFSETVELVRIRPFSPLRDIRQQLDGTRFFPQETLSRTE